MGSTHGKTRKDSIHPLNGQNKRKSSHFQIEKHTSIFSDLKLFKHDSKSKNHSRKTSKASDHHTEEDSGHSSGDHKEKVIGFLSSLSFSSSNPSNSAGRDKEHSSPEETYSRESTRKSAMTSKYSEIMRKRWEDQMTNIPEQDQVDLACLKFNQRMQMTPEYSQEVYLNMRLQESLQTQAQDSSGYATRIQSCIPSKVRDQYAQKIVELCTKKNYKQETKHLALNIFDFALNSLRLPENVDQLLPILLVSTVILAAKIEQPLTPSIKMTIKLLPEEEKELVTKEKVMEFERMLLQILDFDLNLLSPLTFFERFLRLINIEESDSIAKVGRQICLIARCRSEFLPYLPSQIAAICLIMALNLEHGHAVIDIGCWSNDLERYTLYNQKELEVVLSAFSAIYKAMLDLNEQQAAL